MNDSLFILFIQDFFLSLLNLKIYQYEHKNPPLCCILNRLIPEHAFITDISRFRCNVPLRQIPLPATCNMADYLEQNHNSCFSVTNSLQSDQNIRVIFITTSAPYNIVHYSTSCGMKRGWILSGKECKVLTRYHICGHRGSFRFTR